MDKPDRATIDKMFHAAREAVRKTEAGEAQDEKCVFGGERRSP